MADLDYKVIGEPKDFQIAENRVIRVTHLKANIKGKDREYVDVRQFYEDRNSGELKPTAKGIWIPRIDVDDPQIGAHIAEAVLDFFRKE
jgi:hypothetical protein